MSAVDETTLASRARAFAAAFNREALDEVMEFFTDDILYDTFDGKHPRGHDAVRREFEPQFQRRFGRLYFAEDASYVDVSQQTVTMTWICEHHPEAGQGLRNRVLPQFLRAAFGARGAGWRGLDILSFRGELICRKQTFAQARLPLLRRLETAFV